MAHVPAFPSPPEPVPAPSSVRLELRQGSSRPVLYELTEAGFLIGSVPGCDLRLPGSSLPPVLCLIAVGVDGVCLRKLAPTHPILVNGNPTTVMRLGDGDRITLGASDLVVQISPRPKQEGEPAPTVRFSPISSDYPSPQPPPLAGEGEPERRGIGFQPVIGPDRLEAYPTKTPVEEVEARGNDSKELSALRQELYERYRERRDRLAGLQEAVDRAARKVQEHKREVDAQAAEVANRRAELDAKAAALAQDRQRLEAERRFLEERSQTDERSVMAQRADLEERERRLEAERRALAQGQAQHQADLVRLDRLAATQDQRQQELDERARAIEQRAAILRNELQDLEDQARQLSEWQVKLTDEAERVAQETAEFAARNTEVAQRSAAMEGQQAMLATLRTRVERMREEVRREASLLAEQRARQELTEIELERRDQELRQLRAEMDNDRAIHEPERRRFEERSAVLELAVGRTRQLQENLERFETELAQRKAEFDAQAASQAEQAALIEARNEQMIQWHQRLEADRQALREREAALTRAEQAREALQEQLRRRSEELAGRQRALAEQAQQQEGALAAVQARAAEVEAIRAHLEQERQEVEARVAERVRELELRSAELDQRDQRQGEAWQKVQEVGRGVADDRKARHEERERWLAEQTTVRETIAREQAELADGRLALAQLRDALPDLERQARDAVAQLGEARDRLRDHLSEVHALAGQGREELETLRQQVRSEGEQVRQQELVLHRLRDEHRLAVAAFRQQIIEWQGQLSEIKRVLASGETDLERRQAEVDARAREVEATTARLARQSEELDEQHRKVAERRKEMESHLADMREWYRKKLRELVGTTEPAPNAPDQPAPLPDIASDAGRDILSLTGEVEPGDRQLGDLLRSLELVDADTLTALLVEARRQRRSLRQVLLSSNHVTLYQLALIEAGNLDALVLGPTRVIDRLRSTPRETVYRVFDPRRGQEALLRHLGETEARDAIRPDEFRQRFAAAASVRHPHLAATHEVLELAGRPAALQEWLVGLPSADWPALAAVPGVWYRLVGQAALGLHTAHQAGLIHGHLTSSRMVLTADGTLKISGFGEPPWLLEPTEEGEALPPFGESPADDLAALGRIAAGWAAARGKGKVKPLPESLPAILQRLTTDKAEERFPDGAALLEALDQAGADVPPNAEAWERMLRHVREHAIAEVPQRQSA
jgi:hypothetical protein